MQVEKIQLSSIKLETLNTKCLRAVNRCARYLKQHHQQIIRLQDRDVLTQISKLVRKLNNPESQRLYRDLKDKMIVCVNQNREMILNRVNDTKRVMADTT